MTGDFDGGYMPVHVTQAWPGDDTPLPVIARVAVARQAAAEEAADFLDFLDATGAIDGTVTAAAAHRYATAWRKARGPVTEP